MAKKVETFADRLTLKATPSSATRKVGFIRNREIGMGRAYQYVHGDKTTADDISVIAPNDNLGRWFRFIVGIMLLCNVTFGAVPIGGTYWRLDVYTNTTDMAANASPLSINKIVMVGNMGGASFFFATNTVSSTNTTTRIASALSPTYSWQIIGSATTSSGGTTINPTDGTIPVRQDASTFADSPLSVNGSSQLNGLVTASSGRASYILDTSVSHSSDDILQLKNSGADLMQIGVDTGGANGHWYLYDSSGASYVYAQSGASSANLLLNIGGTSYTRLNPSRNSPNTAYEFGTSITHSSGNIVDVKNNTTNVLSVQYDGALIFGPGTTNVLYRNGTDLVYTNGAQQSQLKVVVGDGSFASIYPVGSGAGYSVFRSSQIGLRLLNSGSQYSFQDSTFSPLGTGAQSFSLGNNTADGGWDLIYLDNQGSGYFYGSGIGSGNYERGAIKHNGSSSGWVFDIQASGTGSYRPGFMSVGTTNYFSWQANETANETGVLVRYNGSIQKVTVGAVDSGGSGYRVLRVPN